MQAFEEISRDPSGRDLLQFALTVAAGAVLLGALAQFGWGKPHSARVIWSLGAAVAAGGLLPGLGRLLYIGWMGLGVSVGLVTAPLILFLLYLVVITPVALVFRLIGRTVHLYAFLMATVTLQASRSKPKAQGGREIFLLSADLGILCPL
jgi:hypothetical protein